MGKRGRPTKFTPEIAAEVVKAVKAGMLLQDAAQYAGLDRTTLYRWLKEGAKKRDPKHPLADFCNMVSQGNGVAKLRAIGSVHAAMGNDWKAAAWWLGVTDPKNYGQKVRVTLEEEFSDALARIRKRLPPTVYEQVLEAILEGSGGEGEGADPLGEAGEGEGEPAGDSRASGVHPEDEPGADSADPPGRGG